jgi:DNA-directed RNA polymerase subunit M/transcription elongation factor TFIIS
MGDVKKTQVCKCENCGNEAEMVVTCSLEDAEAAKAAQTKAPQEPAKVKGTATCASCGNEADMWIDI